MKKSRFFLAAGTFVLAITAVFATKANKKFTGVTTAYINGWTVEIKVPIGLGLVSSNSSGTLHTVFATMYTSGGSLHVIKGTLLTKGQGSAVFFN